MAKLSIVVPAYNEAANLPALYDSLQKALSAVALDWECIIVDDHSTDTTFSVVSALATQGSRIRGIRLARNHGSHLAITCGLHHAEGDCAVVLAADMQDPPEVIARLLEQWQAGAQVVWAARAKREGEKISTLAFARIFYFLMRHLVGIRTMPATGADFVLLDRRVIDALKGFREANISIMALVTWMGFRQATVLYTKKPRYQGRSGWTLAKKIKLVIDSVTSFSFFPIRLMSVAGGVVATLGFIYAACIIGLSFINRVSVPGWSSLMVVVLVLGGVQMLMMGVLGEYLWRALDEARHRPQYLIEATTPIREEIGRKPERDRQVA
jgi:glycosyltransferase involved in cell wall biosynthesis